MIEPLHCGIDCLHGSRGRRGRPADQDHLDAEVTRRGDLTVGGVPAAIFGNHEFDGVRLHQRAVVGLAERSARGDVARLRQRQWRIDGIDAAEQINVLWRGSEGREIVAAKRDEDAARLRADGTDRGCGVVDFGPAVAGTLDPWLAPKDDESHAGLARGFGSVRRDRARIGMCRVNQSFDLVRDQIIGESAGAAKATRPYRNGVRDGLRGPAGERKRHVETSAARGKALAQEARFRGAAENKDAWHAKS
jgi:hypothetical protein